MSSNSNRRKRTHSENHTVLGMAQSSSIKERLNGITQLKGTQTNAADLVESLTIFLQDNEPEVLRKIYEEIGTVCLDKPFLQEIAVSQLIKDIWKHPRWASMARSVLASFIQNNPESHTFFESQMLEETDPELCFDMILFAKKCMPSFHTEQFDELQKTCIMKFYSKSENTKLTKNQKMMEFLQKGDPCSDFFKFSDTLLLEYENRQINERDIIRFLQFCRADAKHNSTVLNKFLSIARRRFSWIVREIRKRFNTDTFVQTLKLYSKDVKALDCNEVSFMKKMKALSCVNYTTDFVKLLLTRIEILDSDCDMMRTTYAMSLINNVRAPLTQYRKQPPRIVRGIIRYAQREIPRREDFPNCIVQLQNIKLAIILVHLFVGNRKSFSIRSRVVEEEFKIRLLDFKNLMLHCMDCAENMKVYSNIWDVIKNITYVLENKEKNIIFPKFGATSRIVSVSNAKKFVTDGTVVKCGIKFLNRVQL